MYDGIIHIYPAPNGVDFCTENHSLHECAKIPHQKPEDCRPDIRLRLTCRQISHEAGNIYFTCDTFAFPNSIHFRNRDSFEDRHFKVPGINKIKALCMGVGTCAILNVAGELRFDQLLDCRIDDLEGLQGLSRIRIRIHRCCDHLLPNLPFGFPLFTPLASNAQLKAEVILEMIADEFKTNSHGKSIVCLLQ